jgi:hypothetical protein
MFVRFRQTRSGLQVSLVETRRAGGKVCHEHIASLGSVETPPGIAARLGFWGRVHERLAKLSNRVDGTMQGKILGAVHARVPMVTPQEQQALKLENAEADARLWSTIYDMNAGTVEDHKRLVATAQHAISNGQAGMADAAAKAASAKDRVERIKGGEDVPGGLGKPTDVEKVFRENGFSTADLHYARLVASLPEDAIPQMAEAGSKAAECAARRLARKLAAARMVS